MHIRPFDLIELLVHVVTLALVHPILSRTRDYVLVIFLFNVVPFDANCLFITVYELIEKIIYT